MNTNTQHSQNGRGSDTFAISDYRPIVESFEIAPKNKTKRKCPNCGDFEFSVNFNTEKFDCFNCHETKKITYRIRKAAGDFNKASDYTVTSQKPKQSKKIDDENKITNPVDALSFYSEKLGDKLSYNTRTHEAEEAGIAIDLDVARSWTAERWGVSIGSRELATETLLFLSRKNAYDPVKRMLEGCYAQFQKPMTYFSPNELCKELFGVNDQLYVQYLYRWLIGAIARVWKPGCKLDEALVLQGRPDIYKSTFFRVLAGDEFFTDSMRTVENKDSLLIMAKNWIVEWSEIDSMTNKTYHGTVKGFLSSQDDVYRVPYGKDTKRYPRNSVIVGSTNRTDFLVDPEGNRRFWVIPIPDSHTIPLDFLEDNRQDILGWAVTLFLSGQTWRLPKEYKLAQSEDNAQWERDDLLQAVVERLLREHHKIETNMEWIATALENAGYDKINPTDTKFSMKIGTIMSKLGWKRRQVRLGKDSRGYVYDCPSD